MKSLETTSRSIGPSTQLPWKAARWRPDSLAFPTAHLPKNGTARILPTCLLSIPECVYRKRQVPWIGTCPSISHSTWTVFGGGWERVPQCGVKGHQNHSEDLDWAQAPGLV